MSATIADLVSACTSKDASLENIRTIRDRLYADGKVTAAEVAAAATGWKDSRETQGVFLYAAGHNARAARVLESEAASPVAKLCLAHICIETNQPERALKAVKGIKGMAAQIVSARAQLLRNDVEAADREITALESSAPNDLEVRLLRAEYLFRCGELEQADDLVTSLLRERHGYRGALFLGALIADRADNDGVAIQRYEAMAQLRPISVDALLNLGVLYEDRGEYRHASRCYEAVLREYPTHARARLYLKDAQSALDERYDEDRERKEDKRLQVLRTPVSDFELSVRSRNCLQKMKIESLGDLITKTEQELLAYKNFGETSLQEIKSILASKGLRLGMNREEAMKATSIDEALEREKPKHEGIHAESVDALELSVRARKCMERINVKTIGDLVEHTEQQLLAAPNFGATSLIEVKRKLAELGLSLKA